jgi:hypothetical protein
MHWYQHQEVPHASVHMEKFGAWMCVGVFILESPMDHTPLYTMQRKRQS